MSESCCVCETTASSWAEAKRVLLLMASSGREIYYRGQANSEWGLQSGFGRLATRLASQHGWSEEKRATIEDQLEQQLCEEFRMAYHRLPGEPPLPQDEEEFLALAQHYGLPTRLLDWSRSPYIAAFFAFDGCKADVFRPEHKVAIWVLDWEQFGLFLYYSHRDLPFAGDASDIPEDLQGQLRVMRRNNWARVDKVEISGNPNRRMVYQEGIFTRAIKVKDNLVEYLRERCRYAPGRVLTKITIPGDRQAEVLRELSLMTINPVALMADPQGAASAAFNSAVRFRVWQGDI